MQFRKICRVAECTLETCKGRYFVTIPGFTDDGDEAETGMTFEKFDEAMWEGWDDGPDMATLLALEWMRNADMDAEPGGPPERLVVLAAALKQVYPGSSPAVAFFPDQVWRVVLEPRGDPETRLTDAIVFDNNKAYAVSGASMAEFYNGGGRTAFPERIAEWDNRLPFPGDL